MTLNVPDLCIEVQNLEELSGGGVRKTTHKSVDGLLYNSLVHVAKDRQ